MKFYKDDIVKTQSGRIAPIFGKTFGDEYVLDDKDGQRIPCACLTLIRRADEEPWPADVPRCELPLPDGKTRWAYRGKAWRKDKASFALLCEEEWVKQLTDRAGGFSHHHYAEAVNDEDYVPPQLSETTNSSQVESKVIATPSVEIERTAKITSPNLSGVEILIQSGEIYVQIDGCCGPFLREEAMTFAELLTAAAKEAQQ